MVKGFMAFLEVDKEGYVITHTDINLDNSHFYDFTTLAFDKTKVKRILLVGSYLPEEEHRKESRTTSEVGTSQPVELEPMMILEKGASNLNHYVENEVVDSLTAIEKTVEEDDVFVPFINEERVIEKTVMEEIVLKEPTVEIPLVILAYEPNIVIKEVIAPKHV
ncbi:hypothetical protein RJT34_12676 [Clitoria ternatea]|uniref:Uncharacterized protein n=1 Tax=Clitoria ternatea TaxID=43366 RepID=A0AAN9JPC8_CLITE